MLIPVRTFPAIPAAKMLSTIHKPNTNERLSHNTFCISKHFSEHEASRLHPRIKNQLELTMNHEHFTYNELSSVTFSPVNWKTQIWKIVIEVEMTITNGELKQWIKSVKSSLKHLPADDHRNAIYERILKLFSALIAFKHESAFQNMKISTLSEEYYTSFRSLNFINLLWTTWYAYELLVINLRFFHDSTRDFEQ